MTVTEAGIVSFSAKCTIASPSFSSFRLVSHLVSFRLVLSCLFLFITVSGACPSTIDHLLRCQASHLAHHRHPRIESYIILRSASCSTVFTSASPVRLAPSPHPPHTALYPFSGRVKGNLPPGMTWRGDCLTNGKYVSSSRLSRGLVAPKREKGGEKWANHIFMPST